MLVSEDLGNQHVLPNRLNDDATIFGCVLYLSDLNGAVSGSFTSPG